MDDMPNEIKYHNKKEALAAITQNGSELQFCSPELQNDEDVVRASLNENSWAFYYASDAIKSSKAFIMKALNEGVYPVFLVEYANISIQSDLEVMTLAVEKSAQGGLFCYAKGEAAINKELAAKALVKWGNLNGKNSIDLWNEIHPTLRDFFPENCWHEKAKAYLHHIEQPKNVLGGCTDEDGVVW